MGFDDEENQGMARKVGMPNPTARLANVEDEERTISLVAITKVCSPVVFCLLFYEFFLFI